ncbi:hypothetical protein DPMN_187489 [Dreissena polymorpha]|uniref:Uncharacterized protein n=1 Tax=Dreissena polymorpha TaxID=45954 RepID=A0A9D4DPK2_DREPO|nr:hypothetical protein DPMN_187489 [Dreissena polymorpha]
MRNPNLARSFFTQQNFKPCVFSSFSCVFYANTHLIWTSALNIALYEDKETQCGSPSSTTKPNSADVGDFQVEITVPTRVES